MRSSGGKDYQSSAEVQKEMEALQKQLGAPTGYPDAMEKVKRELEKLQNAALAQAGNGSAPTEAERQKISAALSALSK